MTTVPHDRPVASPRQEWWTVTDIWASLAIATMWVAVVVTAIFGPDIKSADNSGNLTVVPSAVAVAMFAAIASWLVARHAFRHGD